MKTIHYSYLAILLVMATGCGKAPSASGPVNPLSTTPLVTASATPAAVPTPAPTPTTKTVCGISMTFKDGLVYDASGAVIPDGSYQTGGMINGLYFPPCDYTILNGSVCVAGTNCNTSKW